MNIEEAIKHCKDIAEHECNNCGKEHLQLAEWLEKLGKYEVLEKNDLLLEFPAYINGIMFDTRKDLEEWIEGID